MGIQHSKLNMTSYSVGNVVGDLLGAVLSVILFAYYETEVGLPTLLTGIALVIFALWDAVNDTVIGYLSDRSFPFTERWGRRFPWIISMFIPMLVFFILIFLPPLGADPWIIFLWLIITTCIFDSLESAFTINYYGLFPDKFRDNEERVTASAIGTYFIIIGTVLGTVLPPMIIIFGKIDSYILMAWIVVIINLVCYIFLIPGVRDDKETVSTFVENYEKTESEPIYSLIITILKQKNFSMFLILILCYYTMINTWGASLLYYARYVLATEADLVSLFLGTMFIGAGISVLIWMTYVRKTNNNRNVLIYGGLIMVAPAMFLSFISDVNIIFIIMGISGLGVGGFLVMMTPTFSDVVDESILNTRTRNEGLYGGLRFFIMNLSRVTTAVMLTIVHILTGFIEGSDYQPPEAIIGIQLHTGIIPALFFLVGIIIFALYYDITPAKASEIKGKLIELNL